MERNFFGVLSVRVDTSGECLNLEHGTTVHGMQSLDPSQRQEPLGYYYRDSPIGQLFTALMPKRAKQPVGVIGLGTGTLAAYAQPVQQWVFYEINPAVERIAEDERYFTYLRDARARGAGLRRRTRRRPAAPRRDERPIRVVYLGCLHLGCDSSTPGDSSGVGYLSQPFGRRRRPGLSRFEPVLAHGAGAGRPGGRRRASVLVPRENGSEHQRHQTR